MPYHEWGSEFDWAGLGKAMDFISKEYRDTFREGLCLKEKYGTIRYEWLDLGDTYAMNYLCGVIERATQRWPHLAGEIVEDIIPALDDTNPYHSKFAKLLKDLHNEEWT